MAGDFNRKKIIIVILVLLILLAIPAFFLLSWAGPSNFKPLTQDQEREIEEMKKNYPAHDLEQAQRYEELRKLMRETETGELMKRSLSSARDWMALIFSHLVLYGAAAVAGWLAFRPAGSDLPLANVNKLLLAVGISIAVAGPVGGIILRQTVQRPSPLPLLGILLFPVGWATAGAAVKPRDSYLRGALLAAACYLLIGFSWVSTFYIMVGKISGSELWDSSNDPSVFVFLSLFWPASLGSLLSWIA